MSHCVDLMGCLSSKVTNSDYDESNDDDDDEEEFTEEDDDDEKEDGIKNGSDLIASSQEGLEYRVHWDDEASEEYTLPGFSSRPTTARMYSRNGLSSEQVLEE